MRALHFLLPVMGPPKYRLAGLALLAGLGLPAWARAQAPAGPGVSIQAATSAADVRITLDGLPHKGPLAVLYLDGQRRDSTVFATLNPNAIASVEVLKTGTIARQLGPDEARRGIIFITTKAGQHTRRVRAFNRRLARLGRAASPAVAP
jgi:outer membrane receptor protein involved in Fe transport